MDEHGAALIIGIAAIAVVAIVIVTSTANFEDILADFTSSYGKFFTPTTGTSPSATSPSTTLPPGTTPPVSDKTLECGSEITESTLLSSDITCTDTSKTGITINADNIILDCNGHKIKGLDKKSYGLLLKDRKNVVVKNCRFENFLHGVYLLRSNENIFENIKSSKNDIGFMLWNSDSNVFRKAEAMENRRAFYLQDSDQTAVFESTLTGNSQHGIFSVSSADLILSLNRICQNPAFDIYSSPPVRHSGSFYSSSKYGQIKIQNTCDKTRGWNEASPLTPSGIDSQESSGCYEKC